MRGRTLVRELTMKLAIKAASSLKNQPTNRTPGRGAQRQNEIASHANTTSKRNRAAYELVNADDGSGRVSTREVIYAAVPSHSG